MKDIEKKCLQFVLRYYKPGAWDTQKAIRHFEQRNGIFPKSNRRTYWYSGVAATILLFILSGIYLYNMDTDMNDGWTRLVADNSAATYTLPDSTSITLFPHATLSYQPGAFMRKNRQVNMSGKIYFAVRRDAKHPFEVNGSLSHVKVLGTRFQVNDNPESAEVCVVSGKVLFTAKGQGEGVILTKGMEAELMHGEKMPSLSVSGNINQTAWATGIFVFDNTPLTTVLKDLSDFYHVQLTSEDSDKKLTGVFETDNLDKVIDLIENVLHVKIQKK